MTLEYEYDTDTYIVYNDSYSEIGEISSSVSEKLLEKDGEYELVAIVDEVTENDNGKYGAKIKIYFK